VFFNGIIFQVDDRDMTRIRESRKYTDKHEEIFETCNTDHILSAFGLGVKPEYRGRGIAVELLLARKPLMKSLGLTVTLTCFSTLNSQKAAVKADYQEISSMSYQELQSKLPDFDFSNASGTHCKNFILKM
jgi:GNAT superfamily N-acetyltransferase